MPAGRPERAAGRLPAARPHDLEHRARRHHHDGAAGHDDDHGPAGHDDDRAAGHDDDHGPADHDDDRAAADHDDDRAAADHDDDRAADDHHHDAADDHHHHPTPPTTTTTAPPPTTTTTRPGPTTTTTRPPDTTTTTEPPTTSTTGKGRRPATNPPTGPGGGGTSPAPTGGTPGPAPVGGLLLEPQPAGVVPTSVAGPAADPAVDGSPSTTSTTAAGGRSPVVGNTDNGAAADGTGRHSTAGPSAATAGTALPEQLALSDILPFTPTTATTGPADAQRPTGPAPAGDAVADYGHGPHSPWPLLAGVAVGLAVLLIGGGFLWWRNRDSRYWPA